MVLDEYMCERQCSLEGSTARFSSEHELTPFHCQQQCGCTTACACCYGAQVKGLQYETQDLTPLAVQLVELVRSLGQRWSASHVVDVFRGSQAKEVTGWGAACRRVCVLRVNERHQATGG